MKVRPSSRRTKPQSHDQFRRLAAHIESVREEERKRLARQIHDVLGQALTGLKMELAWIASRLAQSDRKLLRRANAMSRLIEGAVQTVREIATELRPGILDQLGLFAAIEWQTEQFQRRTGVACRCSIECPERNLDTATSTALFRILQEILTNVARHAGAKAVEVAVRNGAGKLVLKVTDNGVGIRPGDVRNTASLGIAGMRERAHMLGGEFTIQGRPGHGTSVIVKVPLS